MQNYKATSISSEIPAQVRNTFYRAYECLYFLSTCLQLGTQDTIPENLQSLVVSSFFQMLPDPFPKSNQKTAKMCM